MKKYEEFTVDQTAIAGVQKLLAKEILHALQPVLRGAQLFTKDETLVGSAGKTKYFRTETDITGITTFGDGAPLPDVVTATQGGIDIEPLNLGGKETITADAIDYGDYNVINDVKELLAQAMARAKDTKYFQAIAGETTVTDEAVGNSVAGTQWYQLDHGHDVATDEAILSMTSVTLAGVAQTFGVDYQVDFYKGWIYFTSDPGDAKAIVASYKYADGRQVLDAYTAASASYQDLVAGKSTVVSAYGNPDVAVLNQNEVADLLADDKFLAAASSQSGERAILNGEISKAAGLSILETQVMYEGVIAVLKKGSIGYDCYKERLSSELEKVAGTKGSLYAKIWEKSAPGVTRPSLIALVFNCHRFAKKKV